jgi:hypothetical protein
MGIEEPVGVAFLALGLGMYHTSIFLILLRGAVVCQPMTMIT